jgi:hypothetical protein
MFPGKSIFLKYAILFFLAFLFAAGCAPKKRIVMDLDQYLQNPEAYAGDRVVLSATLDDIDNRYDLYRGKEVTVSAPVTYYGRKRFWTWYLTLQKDKKALRCYTRHYRISAGWDAIVMMKKAMNSNKPLTATGTLRRDGLEVRMLRYENQIVLPSEKPWREYRLIF